MNYLLLIFLNIFGTALGGIVVEFQNSNGKPFYSKYRFKNVDPRNKNNVIVTLINSQSTTGSAEFVMEFAPEGNLHLLKTIDGIYSKLTEGDAAGKAPLWLRRVVGFGIMRSNHFGRKGEMVLVREHLTENLEVKNFVDKCTVGDVKKLAVDLVTIFNILYEAGISHDELTARSIFYRAGQIVLDLEFERLPRSMPTSGTKLLHRRWNFIKCDPNLIQFDNYEFLAMLVVHGTTRTLPWMSLAREYDVNPTMELFENIESLKKLFPSDLQPPPQSGFYTLVKLLVGIARGTKELKFPELIGVVKKIDCSRPLVEFPRAPSVCIPKLALSSSPSPAPLLDRGTQPSSSEKQKEKLFPYEQVLSDSRSKSTPPEPPSRKFRPHLSTVKETPPPTPPRNGSNLVV